MKQTCLSLCEELEKDIELAYAEGVTIEQAERLAAKFLHGQNAVASALQNADLDARMKRSGLKAVKAAVFLNAASAGDKKPSDKVLEMTVDKDELVEGEQKAFDQAEVARDRLQAYFNVFKEAHVFMRGISRGRFE